MSNRDPQFVELGQLEASAVEAIAAAQEPGDATLTSESLAARLQTMQPLIVEDIVKSLLRRERRHIALINKDTKGFEKRNYQRWKPAFVAIEALWQVSHEIGAALNNQERPKAAQTSDYQFEAVVSLHAKTHLVAREAIALMQAGFADGALARWRTMHELTCIALLLSQAPQRVAELYLLSFRFDAYKAAKLSHEFMPADSCEHFTAEEVEAIGQDCERIKAHYGVNLGEEYEWARAVMPQGTPAKKKVSFRDLEEAAGQTLMRPYYKWASQHNHGAYRPADKGLGMVEAKSPLMLTGQSNSGMVDPLQLVARTLAKVSEALFCVRSTFDTVVYRDVIDSLAYRVAPIATAAEAKSRDSRQG